VGGTAGQVLAKIDSTNYNAEWIDAPNAAYTSVVKHAVKAAEAITKGQAVYVSSANGTNIIVSKASNATEATSSKTMGLLETTVSTNGFTNVITEGLLAGLDTSTATAGDPVWLSTGGNLIYGLTNKPSAPAHLVFIGIVTRANNSNGEIFVHVQNGFELQELHNVAIVSPSNGDTIVYDSTSGLWKNQPVDNKASFSFSGSYSGTTWTVAHNLGYRPSVTTMDNALTPNQVEGSISHTDANNLTVTFTTTVTGNIYLS
jgi:hypothetical protein